MKVVAMLMCVSAGDSFLEGLWTSLDSPCGNATKSQRLGAGYRQRPVVEVHTFLRSLCIAVNTWLQAYS